MNVLVLLTKDIVLWIKDIAEEPVQLLWGEKDTKQKWYKMKCSCNIKVLQKFL